VRDHRLSRSDRSAARTTRVRQSVTGRLLCDGRALRIDRGAASQGPQRGRGADPRLFRRGRPDRDLRCQRAPLLSWAFLTVQNATKKERYELRDRFEPLGAQLFFIENVCTDPKVVESNVRAVKLSSPDYKGWDPARAIQDYLSRIRAQEQLYETIEQPSFPCASAQRGGSADRADVKIINGGDRIVINNVFGYLQSRIVFFLMVRMREIARN